MAESSAVTANTLATAGQYNNLRNDVLSTTLGHLHDGTNGRALDSATVTSGHLSFSDNQQARFGTGNDGLIFYDTTDLIIRPSAVGTGAVSIDQQANDGAALKLLSSDITTGLTTATLYKDVTTDDYLAISKVSDTLGGAAIEAMMEDDAGSTVLSLGAYGGTATTAKTTSARALVEVIASEHDGANALANITADGNVFAVRARVGGSMVARLLVDEDGDVYSVTATQTFDAYDDLALLDTYDKVRSGYGDWALEHEQALVRLGILGGTVGAGGLTNWTQLTRLLVGAVRQLGARQAALEGGKLNG